MSDLAFEVLGAVVKAWREVRPPGSRARA